MSSSATLAIVDDDQPFAEYLQTLLKSRGYDTQTYDSGDALLSGLREGALPDVVLLAVSTALKRCGRSVSRIRPHRS
jgi:FixJ family two-component response regulator